MGRQRIRDDQRGFTIVEVLVAITLLLVGVLGTVSLIDGANARTVSTKAREAATNLSRQLVEASRAVPYTELVSSDSLAAVLQSQPGLADGSTADAQWTVRRRDISYTVSTRVCSVDDELDGLGPHASTFCPGSGPSGTEDRNPDDYKRVTVDVSWRDGSLTQQNRQATLIPNPGNAAGPSITALSTTAPTACTLATPSCRIIDPSATEVEFSLTTSSAAQTIGWAIDGDLQAPETVAGSGTSWGFDWSIPSTVVDGTYLITAKAFGFPPAEGVPATAGAERVLTIVLNRFAPAGPRGFVAGRTVSPFDGTQIVDMEWLRNPERDIEGYRVYRVVGDVGGADDVPVCPTDPTAEPITGVTCQDLTPPDEDAVSYYVAAVDRHENGDYRLGDEVSEVRTVTRDNQPAFPPNGAVFAEGVESTELAWNRPDPPDPDAGDAIEFFRIYRDGTAIANRYDRVAGTASTYTDFRIGDGGHSYWISSVDAELGESPLVQAVPAP